MNQLYFCKCCMYYVFIENKAFRTNLKLLHQLMGIKDIL